MPEYEVWKRANDDGRGWTIKYYKGLGTSTAQDAKRYFSNLPVHLKEFGVCSEDERHLLEMAFSRKVCTIIRHSSTFILDNVSRCALLDGG
jgi:DNA topoisomerase-2